MKKVLLFFLCYFCSAIAFIPEVSIITSIYNGDSFVKEFLEDMIRQKNFNSYELILVDANSPGNEKAVIEEYQKKYPNIHYFRLNYDPGLFGVYNYAIKHAKADFLSIAELDDRRNPESLEKHISYLKQHRHIDLTYQDYILTQIPNETWQSHHGIAVAVPSFHPSKMNLCLPGPQPVWRKSMHERYGYFDERFRYGGDWEFWCRAVIGGATFKKLDGYSGIYFYNPNGLKTNSLESTVQKRKDETSRIISTYSPYWNKALENVEAELYVHDRFFQNNAEKLYSDLSTGKNQILEDLGWHKVNSREAHFVLLPASQVEELLLQSNLLIALAVDGKINDETENLFDQHLFRPLPRFKNYQVFVKKSLIHNVNKNCQLKNSSFGTNIFPLTHAITHITGPIIELGCSDHTTPLLHALGSQSKRFILSLDSNREKLDRFFDLSRKWHQFQVLQDNMAMLSEKNWGIACINDNAMIAHVQALRPKTTVFIIQNCNEALASSFIYTYVYDRFIPYTVIASDTINVSEFFD